MQTQLDQVINQLVKNYLADLEKEIREKVVKEISAKLASIDMFETVRSQIKNILETKINDFNFPPQSIPVESLRGEVTVLPENIKPGIIKNFESTGIQDSATDCVVTILNDATVFENKLVARGLEIIGTTVLKGDILLQGEVPTDTPMFKRLIEYSKAAVLNGISNDLFKSFQQTLFERIRADGLDLNKIKLNGKELITENTLAPTITKSNLESVGSLEQLQVTGETLLTNTLYTGNKRVGINTMDPNSTLTIWDEDVEINMGKHSAGTAKIASRNTMVLGSKAQLKLDADGNVAVKSIQIGAMELTSSQNPPKEAKPKGLIVFNENPTLGGPLGWISLGNGRWANFGIID